MASVDLGIITLLLSISAIAISILVFIDNRNKTKIMNKQLHLLEEQSNDNLNKTKIMNEQLLLLKEQSEGKQDLRNAAKKITNIRDKIAALDRIKYDWGVFGKLASQSLLEQLHDSGSQKITWKVYPNMLFGQFTMLLDSFDKFLKFFEEKIPALKKNSEPIFPNSLEPVVNFSSTPKIEETPNVPVEKIVVKDYFEAIYSLKIIHDELESIAKTVNLYDSSLIEETQKIYLKILKAFYKRTQATTELEISTQIKAKELPEYVLKILAFDIWKQCVNELQETVTPRLCEVEKRIMASV